MKPVNVGGQPYRSDQKFMNLSAPINWPAAYVAFCQGHPESEICETFGIKPQILASRMRSEQWIALRQKLTLVTNVAASVPVKR